MIAEALVQVLAGLALLYLAQSRIYQSFEELFFHRLRTGIARYLNSTPKLWLVGGISALLLQASQIPNLLAMHLLKRRIVGVEHALILILGATLGSSLKAWLFAAQLQIQTALFILILGLLASLFRKTRLSLLAMPLLAAGCFWASLGLIWQGLEPLLRFSLNASTLNLMAGQGLLSQIWLILLGFLTVIFLRTGTLSIFIVLQMAWLHLLSLEGGAALIIGINIGMGFIPLELQKQEKRLQQLAWAHLFNRLFFGLGVLVIFPSFHTLSLFLIPGLDTPALLSFRLASLHIGVNLLMAWSGFGLMGIWLRLGQWLARNPAPGPSLLLSRQVRRMLQRSPQYAEQEIFKQLQIALEHTKRLTDLNLRMLTEGQLNASQQSEQELYLFETIQQSTYDLLLPLYARQPRNGQPHNQSTQAALHTLDHCSQLYFQAYQQQQDLFQGISIQLFVFPAHLRPLLEKFQTTFNEVWVVILLKRSEPQTLEPLESSLSELEEAFLNGLTQYTHAQEIWVHRMISLFRQQSQTLVQICQAYQLLQRSQQEKPAQSER